MAPTVDRLRVLVADSYADAADSLALLLPYWGHEARVAYSGPEALLLACRFRPHVALVELRLDGLNGFELARRLREQTGTAACLVALTTRGDAVSRQRSREHGFAGHFVKPVEPERLRRLLLQMLPILCGATPAPPPDADGPADSGDCEWGQLFR